MLLIRNAGFLSFTHFGLFQIHILILLCLVPALQAEAVDLGHIVASRLRAEFHHFTFSYSLELFLVCFALCSVDWLCCSPTVDSMCRFCPAHPSSDFTHDGASGEHFFFLLIMRSRNSFYFASSPLHIFHHCLCCTCIGMHEHSLIYFPYPLVRFSSAKSLWCHQGLFIYLPLSVPFHTCNRCHKVFMWCVPASLNCV